MNQDFDKIRLFFERDGEMGKKIKIKGKERILKAGKWYRTKNLGDSEYFKITFEDGSFLLVLLADEILMFAEEVIDEIAEIKSAEIGIRNRLEYKGRKYHLTNKNDHQLVKNRLFGETDGVEGEVRFSDYEPDELVDNRNELLSLGWLTENEARADIHVTEIFGDEIEI